MVMPSGRLLFVLSLVLSLVLGPGLANASAFATDGAAPSMPMSMKMAPTGTSAPPMCDKCMKGGPAAHTCSNVCVGVQAVLPAASLSLAAVRVRLSSREEQDGESTRAPPDPPPPKLSLLE